jgi:glycosyltransferase involved in cell wall biosynthesis
MNKKRLALIVPQMYGGGAERVVSKLSFILRDYYELTVILFDDREMTYEIGCNYECIKIYPQEQSTLFNRLINVIKRIYRMRKLKKRLGIDVSISFGDSANIINALSHTTDKIVLSIRGYKRLQNMNMRLKKLFYGYIFSKSDSVLCVSKLLMDEFKEVFPSQRKKVELLYNPYDYESILEKSSQPLHTKSELFIKNKIIMSLGTYRNEKGYWHLLKAFKLFSEQSKDYILLIKGRNFSGNKERLSKLVEDLNLSERVILEEFDENPFRYLVNSKLFILPSISEGFPNVLVEAMACGVPVIASDCKTGPREILSLGDYSIKATEIELQDYGILVPQLSEVPNYDPNVFEECDYLLANSMLELLSNKQLYDSYVKKLKERVYDFSYEKCRAKIKQIIAQL